MEAGTAAVASLVEQRIAQVRDDPEGRYRIRAEFYRKYGFSTDGGAGYGASELDFLRWEIDRGVLNPLNGLKPGSPWWRNVNEAFLLYSELAAAIHEGRESASNLIEPVRLWLDYIERPSRQSWYRAHNGSIAAGYLGQGPAATAESYPEQRFINMVLYRLLYAQAMVEGEAPGILARLTRLIHGHGRLLRKLEELIADPRGPSVDVLVHLPDFYPRHYPLSQEDIEHVFHKGHCVAEDVMDIVLISPYLTRLYNDASRWLKAPLLYLVRDDRPCYPHFRMHEEAHAQSR